MNTVFIRPTDGAPAVRIVEGRARGNPISADGEWLVVALGTPPHLEMVATGVGEPRVIPCDLSKYFAWQFFPDGKRLMILGNYAGKAKQIFEVDIEGDGKPRPLTQDLPLSGAFALSHDGKTIAAASEPRIVLIPATGGDAPVAPGCSPGDIPLDWTDDDRALFVSERGQCVLKIFRVDVATGERHE